MRYLFLIFLVLAFYSTTAFSTTIGSYYIPNLVIDQQQGLFIKMHNEVLRRLSLDTNLIIQPTKRTQRDFKQHKLDAYFPELLENLPKSDFIISDPFYLKKIVLFTKIGSDIKTINDLAGKIVGAVAGYSYGEHITKNQSINLDYAKNDDVNIARLMRGYIDAIIGDNTSTVAAIENSKHAELIHYDLDKPINVLAVFYVCHDSISGRTLCSSINDALEQMKLEGIIALDYASGNAKIDL
ncbi:periplasmic component of amino acid ABC-type transporter/signal transduction system [Shewanella psychrophila]|uniref:Periplasmic component of amino acid ABC-type transporter/signal transduction system n=1 Tax=Shewanella psychrophila TaxID=225848 RepID=A0A1S6HXS2_9GAMM|nr:transporter substrate-binding domain-containing protein [Shewanella psychrophila]AQS40333.1 periplasmic component of amino acid ABC-type transporter/signal transduction system [Shewanella psychrophila]